VTYRQLLEFFYKSHDPTTLNRQGNDQGLNYRSAIFYTSPEQEQVAKDVTREANEQWWKGKITTEVVEAGPWWDAEDYHQKYLDNNPNGYQCPTHYLRNFPELKKQEASG
jgi:peptide-methionine (S)-S-oxide reductase